MNANRLRLGGLAWCDCVSTPGDNFDMAINDKDIQLSGITAGTYGLSGRPAQITFNAEGIATSASNLAASGSRVLFAQNAPQTISATTTAKQTYPFTPTSGNVIPGGVLQVGQVLRFTGCGVYSTSAITLSTLTCELDLNGSAALTTSALTALAIALGGSALFAAFDITATVLTIGVSGTLRFDGTFTFSTGVNGSASIIAGTSTVATVDTTGAITATYAVKYGSVLTGNSKTLNQFVCFLQDLTG